MPVAQVDLTGDAARTRVYAYLGAEKGVLQSACAFPSDTSGSNLANWVEIGICTNEALPDSRLLVLAAGYTQQNAPVAWTGHVKLQPTWQIYLALQSSESSQVRLAITTFHES